jgi:outer membrane protein
MQKLKVMGLALLFGALCAGPAMAQNRVAYVDADKVVKNSPQFEEVVRGLEEEFNRRKEELRGKREQLKQLEDKLNRDGPVMSANEIRKLEQDIRSHQRKLKHAVEELDEDMSLRRNEALNRLLRQVQEVVREVGREENLDMIFSTGVAYFSAQVDISDKVLSRLRQKYQDKNQ